MENYSLTSGSYYSAQPYNQFTRAWQASEGYLDIGAKSYRVSDLEKLELYQDNCSFTTSSEIAVRILKVVSFIVLFPLALGALAIRTYYRSKWRVSEHLAAYKGISSFTLTPPGKPIASLAELQAKQKSMIQLSHPLPEKKPNPAQQIPFRDTFGDFPIILPPTPPQIEPQPATFILGAQVAGNDRFRVLERGYACPPSGSEIVDENGYNCLFIRGNLDRDFLIRKG